jgi:diaminopimelate decarboxylase
MHSNTDYIVQPEALQTITPDIAEAVTRNYGSPVYIYNETILRERAAQALAFSAPYGLTVRFAMKANPLGAILRLFNELGLHIDASSGYEAERALHAGFEPERIMITSQQVPNDLNELVRAGVHYNATSLHQLKVYGQLMPGTNVAVRINPGIGSGHSRKTNTGGPTSSFGIWHTDIPEIKRLASLHRLHITKLHTHIGAGTDPKVWQLAAKLTLDLVDQFPEVTSINLGGGFKIARMSYESATDLSAVSEGIAKLISGFAKRTGRRLHLEIEPGTYLVANAGALVSRVIDIVTTSEEGYCFIKLDTGLTEILRPSLYAAQHPIIILGHPTRTKDYVVVGHTCESGDLLTPDPSDPGLPSTRKLATASIGDIAIIEGVGAYCASMSAKNYNSFPEAPEIVLNNKGELILANRPFTLAERLSREL